MNASRLGTLYICYFPLDEPLVATQVIPYLAGLAAAGHEIHLLTFEQHRPTRESVRSARGRLAQSRIIWHWTRYHKRPSLPATIFDALWGGVRSLAIVRRHRLEVVHARAHVAAVSALMASRLGGARLIFDVRGLMAEENVDAGRWREGGIAFRITKAVERRALRKAAGVVVLTEGGRRALVGSNSHPNLQVIPCCVDVRTFATAAAGRDGARRQLNLGHRPVMVYVGKFTGWYAQREMVEFFVAARKEIRHLYFLVVTQSEPRLIETEFARLGVRAEDFSVTAVKSPDVARLLGAADFGISFVRPVPSKVASSPTKNGEYLAAGLPFVAAAGVAGTDDLAAKTSSVVLVEGFDAREYSRAARRIAGLISQPGTRERSVSDAARYLSLNEVGIPRYIELYERVAATSG